VITRSSEGPVNAGDTFAFTVTLNPSAHATSGEVSAHLAGPDTDFDTNCEVSDPQAANVFRCSFPIPVIAQGAWTVDHVVLKQEGKSIPLNSRPMVLHVVANPDLRFPTAAEAALTSSQTDLLRGEAARLKERIQALRPTIAQAEPSQKAEGLTGVLRSNLKEEIRAVDLTEAQYLKILTGTGWTFQAAQDFFADIRKNYYDALASIEKPGGAAKPDSSSPQPANNPLIQAFFQPFEHNRLAYETVVKAGTLVFDLTVKSTPPGATVFYSRRGDQPRQNPTLANSTIRSLPFAIWNVKFEKAGYQAEQRQYDPFHDSKRAVTVELRH